MSVSDEDVYALVLHDGANPSTGGIAICGFSTVGMVGVIAASHIINSLKLTQVGTVLNRQFPAIALVHDEVPKHPVRVYQGPKVGVFTAEIQFPTSQDVRFANTVLDWFIKGGFEKLIIIDGITQQDSEQEGELFGIGSSPDTRKSLKEQGVNPIQHGVVAGIPGYLLSEGDRRGLEIMALMAECNPMYPDARAAALAVEAISEITGIEIQLTSLLEDARRIEESVRDVFEKSQNALPAPNEPHGLLGDRDPMIN